MSNHSVNLSKGSGWEYQNPINSVVGLLVQEGYVRHSHVQVVLTDEQLLCYGLMCQALHVLLQYLMVANYLWMFCEGLHLHLALVVVFVKDDNAMRWFYFIGWFLPAILAGIYALVRSSYPEETSQCWLSESHTQWILTVPVLLSMLASLGFLINVVRVLLTKLHCNSANPAPIGLRKAVRAALILVPLFGIHHILIPFRPEPNGPGERVYQVFSALLVSLQHAPLILTDISHVDYGIMV
ncbi:unnamed protein product [Nezara viridula]|uniref:G-protein coupled receptors family 2 profile 2 domain-containing protein n=1 Tax=Nezara viridula TaxID=85310 RepID=A0A9P0HNK3_NEZVI|nr:unnamed protein product [Nezara viridula]